MKYVIEVINRKNMHVEAIVGENLSEENAKQLEEQVRLLIDTDQYEAKIINAF